MAMDSDSDVDFGFAFNSVSFSDRLLRIEITRGGDGEVRCSSIVDLVRDRKRRREEDSQNETHHELDLAACQVESGLNKNSCERNSENINDNKHGEATMVTSTKQESEPVAGGEDENDINPSLPRVKELHINSLKLASKSKFFYKLFSNGILESQQKHLTLKIDASEEAAVMELLKFMYSNSLTVTTTPALLDVLMAADKFEAASCMKHCSRLLLNMPMTLDSALLLLDLPSTLLMSDSVKPLTNAARQFLTSRYKMFLIEEVMDLPLVGIKTILASDELMVDSEDILYEVVLKWLKSHYSAVEERQEISGTHLAPFIRFPHMSCRMLKKILTSEDFKPTVASKVVLQALFYKLESLPHRHSSATEQTTSFNHRFFERAYNYRPIKIVKFEAPRQQCIVYLDLKRKECEALYPSSRVYSQSFHLGGQVFFLWAQCNQLNVLHCFGLFLGMQGSASVNVTADYEFAARSKPTDEFGFKLKGNHKFTGGNSVGYRNLLSTSWDSFIAKDCPYFINDVLHLRAELTIRL